MKLGSLFGTPKTLASKVAKKPNVATGSSVANVLNKKPKPGEFLISWPKIEPQKVKDYKAILTLADLESYLQRCIETGYASFDWETAADDETRAWFAGLSDEEKKQHRKEYLSSPLDPWKGEICTLSIAAAPHETRVIPISHKKGKNFEAHLTRDKARMLVLDTLEKMIFTNKKVLKIAVNLTFETKFAAKYGKYIVEPVADPLMMWVRCMQVVAPQKILDPKHPHKGWGLKPATKKVFGVNMNEFTELLKKNDADFFDEIAADSGEGLLYSAEDSDYSLQHYLYWNEIAKQIPRYEEWLHKIEMPFQRAIGIMEYWGMKWDADQADIKRQEAELMQEQAANNIKKIARDSLGIEVDTGASGKTKEVKSVIFDRFKLPAAKWSDKTGAPSLDLEALIDMIFMLENNLEAISEEKYLAVPLPDGWEDIDPDASYGKPGFNGEITKDQRYAIRIKKRTPHPYKEQGIALLRELMKIQKYSTLLSSHIKGREKHLNRRSGRIHPGYSTFTETGRCNSFHPNGQNVPRVDNDEFGIRNFHIPEQGKVYFLIDFSGFELRLMAWKSGDEVMIDLFVNNGDMHRRTASEMTGKPESEIVKKERSDAKAGNFGIAYGGTEYALQNTFKTKYFVRKTLEECARIVNAVKKAYKRIPEYQRNIVLEAREKGYVQTIYGYIRLLPGINSANKYERSSAERRASNTPIQGSAADIMKKCQNAVYEKIAEDTYRARLIEKGELDSGDMTNPPIFVHGHADMIAQIHDEMIFELDDDPKLIEEVKNWVQGVMQEPPLENFPVPIIADPSVGYRWGEKKDYEDWKKERVGA
ncbi:bifunctional 3'-5' exonuclease/DNA polymerase [Bacillus haynesii]|uniref:bifunctional 3'-5' exonuclease/DNA polymerase n=1 Tax=Bacillus haynesii TaxID=1925021 RepID=UPI00227E7B4C|nr:bifunctional 3'-5' exonuclease/DNA polymerase [Bacillus haynesii]MCY8609925.1 bifunctional 3'-5' exonuclease/DNA polymerase [Bacillus haynesii]MEC0752160.1 bifunctional 3'-5' exonuclease/DNA polymerase [Bacillus haynesii]